MPHKIPNSTTLVDEIDNNTATTAAVADSRSVDFAAPVAPSSNAPITGKCPCIVADQSPRAQVTRRQSQQSDLAKKAIIMASNNTANSSAEQHHHLQQQQTPPLPYVEPEQRKVEQLRHQLDRTLAPPSAYFDGVYRTITSPGSLSPMKPPPIPASTATKGGSLSAAFQGRLPEGSGATMALNDTPGTTAPSSPQIRGDHLHGNSIDSVAPISLGAPTRQSSGTGTPRVRPTTLDIPGLTRSKVSPDGRIAQRDVGSKLVIVMVGLPARGKSYITKKLARYLNWLQHDTAIFNVGERRREVAGGPLCLEKTRSQQACEQQQSNAGSGALTGINGHSQIPQSPVSPTKPSNVAQIMLNGELQLEPPCTPPDSTTQQHPPTNEINTQSNHNREESRDLAQPDMGEPISPILSKAAPVEPEIIEQNAAFFDPKNKKASEIREQVARETLDELLDYILIQGGSVGILDATNSTLERRAMVMNRIRARAGPDLNVLFLESRCVDPDLLEANMRLKLNGPDYKDKDPILALADFKQRVRAYETAYVPLGEYEEKNNMPYIQMIDVGRKIISHQIKGFLMAQANYYLLNFNLAPRQIWITRHGLSVDNISGKIGGDSDLAPEGYRYAQSLAKFMEVKRQEWDAKQVENLKNTHFPPQPGDVTPPNPYYQPQSPSSESGSTATGEGILGYEPKNFCVWTSMLKRSIQTAAYFDDEAYDIKQMRMLDELNAGVMEGLTYSCISTQYPAEYRARKADKLHYRYPGPGGEGYLDIINRLRPVIVELERMTDHVLLVGHRSVARVLLAYFRSLAREDVADLDVPLGMLYCLEPKPYGVDFKAYKWDRTLEWFYEQPDFKLVRAADDMQ